MCYGSQSKTRHDIDVVIGQTDCHTVESPVHSVPAESGIYYIKASVYAINLSLFFFSARAVQSEAYTV